MSEIIIKTIESVDYSFYERINFERAETETEKQDTHIVHTSISVDKPLKISAHQNQRRM